MDLVVQPCSDEEVFLVLEVLALFLVAVRFLTAVNYMYDLSLMFGKILDFGAIEYIEDTGYTFWVTYQHPLLKIV